MIDTHATKARHRAVALPPEERRAAIIASTVSLLVLQGPSITTHQIAEAAGIAEGTIFRVFPDKESLIAAAIDQAFDPAVVEAQLRAIDPALPLESRLEAAVAILQRRFGDIGRLMAAVGMSKVRGARRGERDQGTRSTLIALAEVLEGDRAVLRREPLRAAELLRGLAFAGGHPAVVVGEALSASEIVSVFLDGVRARPGQPC